jgi:hypothetical protein
MLPSCDNCDTLTETRFGRIRLNRFQQDYYFDDVETKTCPNCDSFYLSDATLNKCYKIIEEQRELVDA